MADLSTEHLFTGPAQQLRVSLDRGEFLQDESRT
jgi:hypothetical protein